MTKKKRSLPIRSFITFTNKGNRLAQDISEYRNLNHLAEDEFEGEGLPTKTLREGEHPFFDSTFEVRASHDEKGTFELTFAAKNRNKHTVQIFEGLTEKQVCNATREFETHLGFVLKEACISWAWACYDKQKDDRAAKKETFETIVEQITNRYKDALIWERRKVIEEIEENGIKTKKTTPIDRGRNKGVKKPRKLSEKEIENKKNRKRKILEAIREATNSESKSELASIIGISRPTLRNWLKSFGIQNNKSFYDLIRKAENRK